MVESDIRGNQSGSRPTAFVRGLLVGTFSIAATTALTVGALRLMRPPDSCGSKLFCLPDVTEILRTAAAIPVALAILGPLCARLLRVPQPWLYAIPASWAVVVVCLGLGIGVQSLASAGATVGLLVLWVSYGVIALWWSGRPTSDRDAARASRVSRP